MADDQATGLRRLFAPCTAHVAAFAGDEALALTVDGATALARLGHRVVVLDRSCGEIAQALGARARYELRHAQRGDKRLADVVLDTSAGVRVLPAARGAALLERQGEAGLRALHGAFAALAVPPDVILWHGAPPTRAPETRVVLTFAPTTASITAAYGTIKQLVREQRRRAFHVVVERARTEAAGQEAFTSIAATAARFLDAKLELAAVLAPRTGAPDAAGAEPRTQAIARIAATLLAPGAAAPRRAVND